MTKTKQIPHGASSSHRPVGMAAARFTGAEEEAEQQYADAPGEETEDSQDWPDVEGGKTGTSKSTGKAGDPPQQTKENPPPAPQDPQPSMSKDPTDLQPTVDPTVSPPATPTQDPAVAQHAEAEEETPPKLTAYVKS